MTTATSKIIPRILPPELWLEILSYSEDPVFVWRTSRLVSHAVRAGAESLFRSHWIPKRTMIAYCVAFLNPKRGTFSHYSADGRMAYFITTWNSFGTVLAAKGLCCGGPTWLYMVVGRYFIKSRGAKGKTVRMSSNRWMLTGECGLTDRTYSEGTIGHETRVHVDEETNVIGIDWKVLLNALLKHSRKF
ncbi:hypothetical protein CC86DRAFT_411016 [Ophiobolus disseminans]|uniref:F-box domain-containing protein n=1 Tax=Ophiobolus disseminans TaxID=1469910 RepID=A0A6A6ZKX9_9PLEO|nr:hypothetical protein CC86DRAFT_411016 [Ophiobolus disseminans]